MNRFINILSKITTCLLAITYGLGSILYFNGTWFLSIIILIFSIFILMTTIVDILRYKKIDIKINILNLILNLVILLNIYRPFIDNIIPNDMHGKFDLTLRYCQTIYNQNFVLITIFMVITFILNFKYKSE